MLEYFTIKKFRKHNRSTASVDNTTAPLTPLLAAHDERFLAQVINEPAENTEPEDIIFHGSQSPQALRAVDTTAETTAEDVPKTASPAETTGEDVPKTASPAETTAEDVPKTASPVATEDGDWKVSLRNKWGYLEALGATTASRLGQAVGGKGKDKGKGKGKEKEKAGEAPADEVESTATTPNGTPEIIREDQELTDTLERLNCAASNGTVLSSPSAAIKPLIHKFTQIFKDLMNGVPTAYDDLISLFDSSSSLIEKTYSSLPNFIKQIIQSIPDKMTPAILRTLAATSPALAGTSSLGLKELVTTPGILGNLLKSIVQVLRTRFPMLLGGGVAAGLGVFVLFFGLWYCYKRGKETREEREEAERMETFGVERIKTEKELKKEKVKAEKEKTTSL